MKPEIVVDGSIAASGDGWISKACNIVVGKIASEGNINFSLSTGNHDLYDYFPFNARIFLSGQITEIVEFSRSGEQVRLSYPIHDPSGPFAIRIESDYAAIPSERGLNDDQRELSLIVSDFAFDPVVHLRSRKAAPRGQPSTSPIFVIGPHRPDTRRLAWAIGQHPNVAPMDETGWMPDFYVGARRAFEASRRASGSSMKTYTLDLDDVLRRQGQMIDQMHHEISRRRSLEVLFSRLENMSPNFDRRFQTIRSPHSTKGRWIDGTAGNTDLAIGLSRMFPEARFIGTLGRPSAAVTSLLATGQTGVGADAFEGAVEAWERATQWLVEAIQHLGPGRALLVRQGDVTENPAKVMRNLLEFCGEPYFRGCETSLAKDGTAAPASLRLDDAQSSRLFDLENIYEQVMSGAAMADIRWTTSPVAFDDRCTAAGR